MKRTGLPSYQGTGQRREDKQRLPVIKCVKLVLEAPKEKTAPKEMSYNGG